MLYKVSEVAQRVEVFVIKPDFDLQDPHKQKNMTDYHKSLWYIHSYALIYVHTFKS